MKNYIFGTIAIFIILGCNNKKLKYEYYENGNVKQLIEYVSFKDTSTYKIKQYYENGSLKRIITYLKGKPNGKDYSYFENGQLQNETSFLNGKLHGMNKIFAENGFKLRESLYIENEQKIFHEYLGNSLNQIKMQCYAVNNGKGLEIGQIVYDKNSNILLPLSFYYNIEAYDTISYGQDYEFKINALIGNCSDSCTIELKIGDLDKEFQFKNEKNTLSFESKNSSVYACIKAQQLGYNLMLGMLYIREGSDNIANFVVFKEFYVKE